jgi:superoxide dismutase, Fe-Mn family
MMTRRDAIKTTLLATTAVAVLPTGRAEEKPLYMVPKLPYAFDALEPHIDARTMEIHHDKHHATYVANLNKAVAQLQGYSGSLEIQNLLQNLNALPESLRTSVRNNGGGHYNHSLFWQMMKKDGGGAPKTELAAAIDKNFGSLAAFKEQFTKAALGQFGSGWAWLVSDAGTLKIEATANQDTPLAAGRTPLLGLDVWEHAYYLKYQNKRADYIAAWFNVVDWDFVSERLR